LRGDPREFSRRFLPNDLLLARLAADTTLPHLVPFTALLVSHRGAATAYVCVNHACRLPTTDPIEFARSLESGEALDSPTAGSRRRIEPHR
jgi:hypothetical protein